MGKRVPISFAVLARSILLGWTTLLLLVFLVERPLLLLTARLLGVSWFAAGRLTLECGALAAAGWVTARGSRPSPLLATMILAPTLSFWDFGGMLDFQLPWLFRLAVDAAHDFRFMESLLNVAATHVFLFGSLIAGAQLGGRSPAIPLSIADRGPR